MLSDLYLKNFDYSKNHGMKLFKQLYMSKIEVLVELQMV